MTIRRHRLVNTIGMVGWGLYGETICPNNAG